jgi:hypothetical protein
LIGARGTVVIATPPPPPPLAIGEAQQRDHAAKVVYSRDRFATDARGLAWDLARPILSTTPSAGPVRSMARASSSSSAATASDSSFLLATGDALTRLDLGVSAEVTTASAGGGFDGVVAMWGLRGGYAGDPSSSSMLVLSFSQATRVFVVRSGCGVANTTATSTNASGAMVSFEEAPDGAGLDTNECTIACGAWAGPDDGGGGGGGGSAGERHVIQATPSRVRLCGGGVCLHTWYPGNDAGPIGAVAVAPHGRIALSLPRSDNAVVVLRRGEGASATKLIRAATARFDREPSCLCLPPPPPPPRRRRRPGRTRESSRANRSR